MESPATGDLYRHQAISGLAACAETDAVAFVVDDIDRDAGTYRSTIWLCDGRGPRPLTDPGRSSYGAAWAPDGSALAFLRADGDGRVQVHVLAPDGGEARQLSRLQEQILSIEQWCARSGRLLVRVRHRDAPGDAPCVADYLPYKKDGSGFVTGDHIRLYTMDARTGEATPRIAGGGDVIEAKWSPDGRALAFLRAHEGPQRHLMDLWIAEEGHVPRRFTSTLSSISGLSWSPDGRHIALSASETEGDSVAGLYVLDVRDAALRRMGELEVAIPGCVQWVSPDRVLVLEAWRGLQRATLAGLDGRLQPLTEGDEQVIEVAATPRRLVYAASGLLSGPRLWQADLEGRDARELGEFNRWRAAHPPCRAGRRRFEVPDGEGGTESIEGWLIEPEGEGPFPLLVEMHGGPHSYVLFDYATHVHWPVLAARGWAILALNAVGSSSFGEAFAKRLCGRWGELDLPQHLAAVEQLQQEGIAGRHVACFGHSYGGFLAAWALGHPGPFVAGVVSAGVINLESHTGTSDSGYYVGPYSVGCEVHDDRERYRRMSPVGHAHRIRAPTLILQGQDDQRCPVGQAEELFATIVRCGNARARMVVYPGGTHHVSSTGRPGHREHYFDALIDWLEAHGRRADAAAPSGTD